MKKRNVVYILLALLAILVLMPMKAEAGWKIRNGKKYYYTSDGTKITGWLKYKGKRYYLNEKGVVQSGWQKIDGYYYYFSTSTKQYGAALKGSQTIGGKSYYFATQNGRLQTKWYTIGKKKYYATKSEGIYTGLWTIDGQTYIFSDKGVLQTGWTVYDGSTYYCTRATGAIAIGLSSIGGKLYYFDASGAMQRSTTVTVNGVSYSINSSGVCSKGTGSSSSSSGTADDMLFFTLYESGSEGYGQVGGDNGNACGKYQFDRRYSLIPFVKYCYSSNRKVFAAFKTYAKWSNTTKYQNKLKNNKKFYKAWTSIYKKYPVIFKEYQDAFALQEYYEPVEAQLKAWGIDISSRPYIVKGTVFSYSIQHGTYSAALAVRYAGIKNATSDKNFIKKLYQYRISKFPAYKSRYTQEMKDALSYL